VKNEAPSKVYKPSGCDDFQASAAAAVEAIAGAGRCEPKPKQSQLSQWLKVSAPPNALSLVRPLRGPRPYAELSEDALKKRQLLEHGRFLKQREDDLKNRQQVLMVELSKPSEGEPTN
jgi:hypothetical protein